MTALCAPLVRSCTAAALASSGTAERSRGDGPLNSFICGTALFPSVPVSAFSLMVRIYLKREPARECLEGRLAGMRQALSLEPEAPIGDDALTGEAILAVAPVEAYDLTLGTGGPADWLRVFVEHGDLNRVEYHYADWGAHERVELTPDEEATLLAWINRFARVWE